MMLRHGALMKLIFSVHTKEIPFVYFLKLRPLRFSEKITILLIRKIGKE